MFKMAKNNLAFLLEKMDSESFDSKREEYSPNSCLNASLQY